jgi:hypothetical protein
VSEAADDTTATIVAVISRPNGHAGRSSPLTYTSHNLDRVYAALG